MQIGTITLPNPEWGDSKSRIIEMNAHRMMDGTLYTYVRKSADYHLTFTISNLSYGTFVALKAYLISTAGTFITLIDWDSVTWGGYIRTNPASIVWTSRGIGEGSCFETGGNTYQTELGSITLEFEGAVYA
jgi:hypothetical protein